ncbi:MULTISPECIES: oxidase [Pseudomonas]|uniref:oxidase n=1 Tax=Pseudomonas TaxID=286 RepID=UPI00125F4823|nr:MULTISPECIES: oxidase [Pseudomonas]KAB5621759.1 oxidase [Pseudomonas putida]MBH3463167.1 oxidase [Pseudomonas putida]MBK0061040.1 oxidase [Pseudomonas sp. S44]
MSILSVFHSSSPQLANKVLTHHEDIAATLAEQGVQFARHDHGLRIRPGSAEAQVREEAGGLIDMLMTTHGCQTLMLLNRDGDQPTEVDLRDEHVHDAVEVFAMVSGRGQISLRLGEQVFALLCEKGDVLVVPAQTRRWIDLGDTPFCLAVRLFGNEQGIRMTGDEQARQFAGMSEL